MSYKIPHGILILFIWHSSILVNAQYSIQFSQYFSNPLVLNPAYAGSDGALSITAIHRNQWSGVDGAPKTTTLSGHALFKNEHMGLGFNLLLDEINIHSSQFFTGIYSFRIKFNENNCLSFGIQASINHIKSDYSSLIGSLQNQYDPNILSNDISESFIQFGTGMYYQSSRLEIGLSAPVIHSSSLNSTTSSSTLTSLTPHYFLFTRLKVDLSSHLQLHPGFLLKSKPGWPLSFDLNLDALINQSLLVGLSYRSFETVCTIVQINVLPQMRIGYSYDIPLSDIQRRNFNTNEFMINYIFQYKNYNVRNPR